MCWHKFQWDYTKPKGLQGHDLFPANKIAFVSYTIFIFSYQNISSNFSKVMVVMMFGFSTSIDKTATNKEVNKEI